MKRSLARHCPICDSLEGEVVHTQSFVLPDASPLPKCYNVVHCPECGFCFADVAVSQEEYTRYYRLLSKYEEDVHTPTEDDTPDQKRYKILSQTLMRISESTQERILDIGCARGGLLSELSKLGFTSLTGLDPSENCVRHVRRLGMDAFQGDLFDLDRLPNQMFGGVILSCVLEHLQNVRRVPEIIAGLLCPDGYCYVDVPDASQYGAHPIAPYYYFDCEHINHFDGTALDNLFLRHGFCRTDSSTLVYPMPHSTYPAVYGVYRKFANVPPPPIKRTDNILRGIHEHLAWSKTGSVNTTLSPLLQNGTPLVVWGAGQMTMRLLATTLLSQCNILFFVDNDSVKHHSTLHGIPVLPPSALREHTGPILVVSVHFADEIVAQIRGAGYDNPIIPLSSDTAAKEP